MKQKVLGINDLGASVGTFGPYPIRLAEKVN